MQTQTTATTDLSNFIDESAASWNRQRTAEELRTFIDTRHRLLDDIALFD